MPLNNGLIENNTFPNWCFSVAKVAWPPFKQVRSQWNLAVISILADKLIMHLSLHFVTTKQGFNKIFKNREKIKDLTLTYYVVYIHTNGFNIFLKSVSFTFHVLIFYKQFCGQDQDIKSQNLVHHHGRCDYLLSLPNIFSYHRNLKLVK